MNKYNLSSNGALAQNSSGGKLLKWKIGNKFIKTSTYDQSQLTPIFLYESYAEVIVYRIAKQLGLNVTPYKLCKINIDNSMTTIACESEDFRLNDEQYISVGKLMIDKRIPKLYYGDMNSYALLVESMSGVSGFEKQLRQTLFLDYLTLNDDRHYGNFGIIQSKEGKCRAAPIFDNGNSLFCHKHTNNIQYDRDLIHYLRCKPFSTDFDTQVQLADNISFNDKKLKEYVSNILYNLVTKYELPKDRADFIKHLLNDRINTIVRLRQ